MVRARIVREFDRFSGYHKYILRCNGILNGTIMGDTLKESIASLTLINYRRKIAGADEIVLTTGCHS